MLRLLALLAFLVAVATAHELAELARREAAWAHATLDKYVSRHGADGDAARGEWGQSARDARDFADSGGAPRDLQGAACALVAATAAGMCGTATACTAAGSAAYTTRTLAYSAATGIFTGSITTNQCPHIALESTYLGVLRSTREVIVIVPHTGSGLLGSPQYTAREAQ